MAKRFRSSSRIAFLFIGRNRSFAAALLCLLLADGHALARRAEPGEAEVSGDQTKIEINIKADGTYEYVFEALRTILNEAGRSKLGTMRFPYNAEASEFEVLVAETIVDGKTHTVSREFIEDKPRASQISGFDQQNQVIVAFPHVEVGAQVHLKYRLRTKEVPFLGFYSSEEHFGAGVFDKMREVTYTSELPLHYTVSDPFKVLDVKERKTDDDLVVVTARLKEPFFFSVVDEEKFTFLNRAQQTFIVLATSKSFEDLARSVAKDHDKVMDAKLPETFAPILERARKDKSFVDVANTVTSMIADQIRYMGDWRPVRGSYVPRALERIAVSRFGDCKDFAALTGAVLRRLGYKAQIAWVERSRMPSEITWLPSDSFFNHAIVRAEAEGKTYWIDATNRFSFAQGIPEDIYDRSALVIDPVKPRIEKIPLPPTTEATLKINNQFKFDREGDASAQYRVELSGRRAIPWTGIGRYSSKEALDHSLTKWAARGKFTKWSKVGKYDVTSRIVKTLPLSVDVGLRKAAVKSTKGFVYILDPGLFDFLINIDSAKYLSNVFIGLPEVLEFREELLDSRLVGKPPPVCEMESPWITARRKIETSGKKIIVIQNVLVRKSVISNEELKSQAFKDLQTGIENCLGDFAVSFEI